MPMLRTCMHASEMHRVRSRSTACPADPPPRAHASKQPPWIRLAREVFLFALSVPSTLVAFRCWPSRSFTTFAKCHQAATQQLQHITNHLPISFFSRRLLEVNILLKAIPYKTTYTAHCIVPSCRDVLITSYAMFPYVIKKRQRSPPLAEGQHLQIGLDDFFSHARCTGWCPQ